MSNNSSEKETQNFQTDSQAAKLAILGGALTTFGDAITTVAAIMALEEERQANNNNDTKRLQKQIDYLTSEHEKLKRQLNNQKSYLRT
ncbi:hypothetical protein CWR45_12890 [Oceanobacillus chungangensis]|uniref:Translation initiation factor 2 n=1 Tax=Oceanobacillus chungangensis TaxID=1229152 RepID=A0A3D8PMJ0_9BACI|nr:hypothetical protein CWR45_12890 [Oceanobacillus chungangensis]